MPRPDDVEEGQHGQGEGQDHHTGLGDDEQLAARDAVRHDAGVEHKKPGRHAVGEAEEAEIGRGLRQLIDQEPLGRDLHPGAEQGGHLSPEPELVVPVTQGRERLLPAHPAAQADQLFGYEELWLGGHPPFSSGRRPSGALQRVPRTAVARGAPEAFPVMVPQDRIHHRGMTGHAVLLKVAQIARRDPEMLDVLEGEGPGMAESVLSLGHVFPEEVVRDVTVVARDRAVAGDAPAFIIVPHDVAIDAGLGFVGEIGKAPGVPERVGARSGGDAESQGDRGEGSLQRRPPSGGVSGRTRARTAEISHCRA